MFLNLYIMSPSTFEFTIIMYSFMFLCMIMSLQFFSSNICCYCINKIYNPIVSLLWSGQGLMSLSVPNFQSHAVTASEMILLTYF